MEYQNIIYDKQGHIVYTTLNRPEKLNAMNKPLLGELMDAVRQAEYDEEVRVVVLKGAGRAFSAGADIAPPPSSTPAPVEDPYANIRKDIQNMKRQLGPDRYGFLWHFSKPIIVQVHGYCLEEALDMAMNCDIIVAAENATFSWPGSRFMGSPPSHMWTYHVGPQWAKYMLLTGNAIDGKTAERIGLVLKAVPVERLAEEVDELAGVMARIPWELLAANKSICNKAADLMGRTLMQELGLEMDTIGHQQPGLKEFMRIAKEQGLKAALEWRDGPFRR